MDLFKKPTNPELDQPASESMEVSTPETVVNKEATEGVATPPVLEQPQTEQTTESAINEESDIQPVEVAVDRQSGPEPENAARASRLETLLNANNLDDLRNIGAAAEAIGLRNERPE